MFLERIYRINDDTSDLSVLTQKQILKIFFTFIQVFFFLILLNYFLKNNFDFFFIKFILPLDVLDKQSLTTWIETCNLVLQRPIPEVTILSVKKKIKLNYLFNSMLNKLIEKKDKIYHGGKLKNGR